mgnify:CR=1 FL=1
MANSQRLVKNLTRIGITFVLAVSTLSFFVSKPFVENIFATTPTKQKQKEKNKQNGNQNEKKENSQEKNKKEQKNSPYNWDRERKTAESTPDKKSKSNSKPDAKPDYSYDYQEDLSSVLNYFKTSGVHASDVLWLESFLKGHFDYFDILIPFDKVNETELEIFIRWLNEHEKETPILSISYKLEGSSWHINAMRTRKSIRA